METTIKFGNADKEYALAQAILIYRHNTGYNSNCDSAAATVHDVQLVHGKPSLAPGSPLTVTGLEALLNALGRNCNVNFIPEEVVSVGLDRMAWWCPAGRRRIWFKPSTVNKEVTKLNGKFVWHPPLIFVARTGSLNSLRIFAMPDDKRPGPETKLYRAPYWNIDATGLMCRGNIRYPNPEPASIAAFNKAFFDSAFSHTSHGVLTRHKGGHDALWAYLVEKANDKTFTPDAPFWDSILVPTKKATLASIFKNNGYAYED